MIHIGNGNFALIALGMIEVDGQQFGPIGFDIIFMSNPEISYGCVSAPAKQTKAILRGKVIKIRFAAEQSLAVSAVTPTQACNSVIFVGNNPLAPRGLRH